MADSTHTTNTNTTSGSGSTGIAFIVGILVVVVAVLGYVLFSGAPVAGNDDITISIEGAAPAAERAADAIEGAATPAPGN